MKTLALKTVSLLLFAMVVSTVSATVAAQGSAQQTPGRPTTDQQMSGEALFYQNCTFCHEHDALKRRLVPQFLGPSLIGTYKTRNLPDDAVRSLIMNGVPKRMTGFRHTLTAKDIDDIIAYLKVR